MFSSSCSKIEENKIEWQKNCMGAAIYQKNNLNCLGLTAKGSPTCRKA